MKKTINQQSHIINEQSHSSMRHGTTYKKAIMNGDEPYSACTNVSLPFGNLTFVWRFGNFNPVGPAATPLCPARRPAAVALTAVRALVRAPVRPLAPPPAPQRGRRGRILPSNKRSASTRGERSIKARPSAAVRQIQAQPTRLLFKRNIDPSPRACPTRAPPLLARRPVRVNNTIALLNSSSRRRGVTAGRGSAESGRATPESWPGPPTWRPPGPAGSAAVQEAAERGAPLHPHGHLVTAPGHGTPAARAAPQKRGPARPGPARPGICTRRRRRPALLRARPGPAAP
jgi:hypothetical protein